MTSSTGVTSRKTKNREEVFALMPKVLPCAETTQAALAYLERNAATLQPVADWDGGLVEGYKDLLGLNGREPRNSVRQRKSTRT